MYKIIRGDMTAQKDIDEAAIATAAWQTNQERQLTGEAFVEVEYNITNPDLPKSDIGGATSKPICFCKDMYTEESSGSPKLFGSEYYDIIEKEGKPPSVTRYATLEKNRWLLDGSMITPPAGEPYKYCGYVSKAICCDDEDNTFEVPVLVRIYFSEQKVNILPGLTVVWDTAHGEYATKVTITSYREDGAPDKSTTFSNDKLISEFRLDMEEFKWIDIEILNWSAPNRRARIGKIFMGLNKVYDKTELLKFSCNESIDPLSASLPKYEIQFEVDNREGTYNPANDDGVSKSMMERQEVRTWYSYWIGDAVERIPGGVYYLSEWSAPQNGLSASFKARDLLGFMNATYYKGRFPTGEVSLYELAEDVLKEAGLPTDRNDNPLWDISELEKRQDITTKAPLPVCSMAECLQLIANAACCSMFFDRTGKLHIAPLDADRNAAPNEDDENPPKPIEINYDNSYSKAEINLIKPVKQVDVSMYSYTEEPSKELYKGELSVKANEDNVFMIEYSDLTADAVAEVDDEDVTIVECEKEKCDDECFHTEYYAKYCKLVLRADADKTVKVSINGKVLKPMETIITVGPKDIGDNETVPNTSDEILPLKNNTLITDDVQARAIGKHLMLSSKYRKRFDMDLRIDPRTDVGDVAIIRNAPKKTHDEILCDIPECEDCLLEETKKRQKK